MRPLAATVAALLVAGCNWERCDGESVDFELLQPGDAIEIRIEACTDRRDGNLDLAMELSGDGTPTAPLALLVDGIRLFPQPGMRWLGGSSDLASDEDCAPGKLITLRRLDADPAIAYRGTLSAEMSAPPLRTCSVAITVTPH